MGPAPVIDAEPVPVGVMLKLLVPLAPLTISVSLPAVGSLPSTVIWLRPVGVNGLFRLIASSPARALIVSVVLFEKSSCSKPSTEISPVWIVRDAVI